MSQVADEHNYQQTLHTLSTQNKPPRILCFLMNLLESYRQSRKMGWSRAWNKYGLTTFQSFQLSPTDDQALITTANRLIHALDGIPSDALSFMQEILHEKERLMGFIFISEYSQGNTLYESATLSFGAKVKGNPRYRERFDIIFDCPIIEGQAQALSRLRLYVDPYRNGAKKSLYQTEITAIQRGEIRQAFTALCECSWQWHDNPEKLWTHWTSNCIDYFGERKIPLQYSHFYLPSGSRIEE